MAPFMRTPASGDVHHEAGAGRRRAWLRRWMAVMAIQAERTMRVSALTKAARTPARW